jgi:hypothetical protein
MTEDPTVQVKRGMEVNSITDMAQQSKKLPYGKAIAYGIDTKIGKDTAQIFAY